MKTVLLVFGTRPEAIKMCPLVNELKRHSEIDTLVCATGQHRQMLGKILEAFSVVPEYDLSIMKDKQALFDITTTFVPRSRFFASKFRQDTLRRDCVMYILNALLFYYVLQGVDQTVLYIMIHLLSGNY